MNTLKKIKKAALAALMLIAVSGAALLGAWAQTRNDGEKHSGLRSTIAFVSSRHDPAADPAVDAQRAWLATEIYLMDGDGTNVRRVTENTYSDGFPSLSPDGKRIVFSCRRGGSDFEICVMNADGTGQVQLTDNTIGDLTPSWSPDGNQIVFHRRVGGRGQFQLFLINADGA